MSPLNKHFVISLARDAHGPQHWRSHRLGKWVARHGADIRHHPVAGSDGRTVGLVLGWLISNDGLLADGSPIAAPIDGEDPLKWSAAFCGRFVILLEVTDGSEPFMFLDAGGLLGTVFSRNKRTIASIPDLIPDSQPDHELRQLFGIPSHFGWYPFGLTPAKGTERLLPNFRLDFSTFEIRRMWPLGDIPAESPEVLLHRLYSIMSKVIVSLVHGENVTAHLTAGSDSRMVLAAAWSVRDQLRFVTINGIPGTAAALDARVASRLASRFGLIHEIRPYREPNSADVEAWNGRTGECVADHLRGLATTLKSWDPTEIQIAGISGEVGRAFYWSGQDLFDVVPEPKVLLTRLGMPVTERTISAADAWRATLPSISGPLAWDLAYVEQRLGCWAGASVYGAEQRVPSLTPFNSRAAYETMLALPPSYRSAEKIARDLVSIADPELARVPFNRPMGFDALRFPKLLLKSALPPKVRKFLKDFRQFARR